jgi:3,4-dihydroxy 2-butanone 4-phosphate synthase/GTP cyclohydrolase II
METFAPVPAVLDALKRGGMVVLVDDEERENEGDLVMAAQFADPQAIAFMATKGCGLICLAMAGQLLDRLGLPLMTRDNRSRLATAFTLSIEAREGVTTGISAADRSRTIQVAIADAARPEDVVSPGHVFPLRARDGGVLVRAGHSEASTDLCRLAGLKPAAVICEIMRGDGAMARLPDLIAYGREHGLLLASIADLIAYREAGECLVECAAEATVDTEHGAFRVFAYRSRLNGEYHLALVKGERLRPGGEVAEPVLVRVQKEALLGDVFGLHGAGTPHPHLAQLAKAGEGVFVYMRDGGHGLPDLLVKLGGSDHRRQADPEGAMDPRDYGLGAQILHHLGVRRMRLITASDRHLSGLAGHGLEVVERVKPGTGTGGGRGAGVPDTGMGDQPGNDPSVNDGKARNDMLREMLQAKLHRARITAVRPDYEGSLTVDPDLIERAGMLVHQKIGVYDITNGARFETYLIPGERGKREVIVNGAAARLALAGDRIIIATYGSYSEAELAHHQPVVLMLDERNEVIEVH